MSNDSRDLEVLVAKIQEQLAPGAEVIHNARMKSRSSGKTRQIDVLVRQRLGQYEMNIVLECKDYSRPVDIKGVEAFHGLLEDVGANKGALVCPAGFSQGAKDRASGLEIDLYSPIDTDPHKWQVKVQAPVLCDFRAATMSFELQCSTPAPFELPSNFLTVLPAFSKDGQRLTTSVSGAVEKWNAGRFPSEPGEHRDLPIFDTKEVLLDNGFGQFIPVALTVSLWIERQLFFGHLPIERLSGFKDELSGGIITDAFTTGIFDPEEVTTTWQSIASEAEAVTRPLLKLTGRVAWSNDVEIPLF